MNFHVEPISGMNFHVRPDLQNEKNEKNEKKLFRFFFSFFILKIHFFWSPKKVHSEILPTSKVHFSFRKNVRSKSLFFVYLLVSKFQVQIPYSKPALNPKSLGFRV